MEDYDNAPSGESCWDAWLRTIAFRDECMEDTKAVCEDPNSEYTDCVRSMQRWRRSAKLLVDLERHLSKDHAAA